MSNPRDFGAVGDGRADDTAAIEHTLRDGDGRLDFSPGTYLITRPIAIPLDKGGRFALTGGAGAAKIVMAGAGPAFHLIGTHAGTAGPEDFQPPIWVRERMPTVLNVEIEGRHAEADGFWLEATMQSTFEGVLLRRLRHGIRVQRRARNILVSHCHIYD